MTPRRALENIAAELQRQYERWQSKARYKSSLDPTQEDIKKLCMTLRRNARVCTVIENIRSHFIGVGRTYTISL
jgi:regulator-associated protein of mTOR